MRAGLSGTSPADCLETRVQKLYQLQGVFTMMVNVISGAYQTLLASQAAFFFVSPSTLFN